MTSSIDEITNFSLQIEEIVEELDVSYIEAVVIYCERTGFEIELASKLITTNLKSKIRSEAEELHYLPKSNTAKLPFV